MPAATAPAAAVFPRAAPDGLRAEHRYGGPDSGLSRGSSYSRRIEDYLLVAIHPVVRVHPVTGRF
jgi:alpha-ketoglutarate-dependent sulfate ester dioxygenase